MTDNEIIKALECCINPKVGAECPRAKFVDMCNDSCVHILMKQALDLINCQKAEIESKELIIKRLKECVKEVYFEAVKEFAEKVYRFICNSRNWNILKSSWLWNGECDWLKQ